MYLKCKSSVEITRRYKICWTMEKSPNKAIATKLCNFGYAKSDKDFPFELYREQAFEGYGSLNCCLSKYFWWNKNRALAQRQSCIFKMKICEHATLNVITSDIKESFKQPLIPLLSQYILSDYLSRTHIEQLRHCTVLSLRWIYVSGLCGEF